MDVGYDINDYTAVAPEYGTLDDFNQFLEGAHQRGLRVVLDLVLNHTSDQHAWFLESRSSLTNPKRDWYVWQDGSGERPPNNWNSVFGGPAWEFDALTGQYYYHFFLKEQPDLNWRNSEVKQAMFAAARFWLDLGVDGFRLDAIETIFEHPELPDHEATLSEAELYRAGRKMVTVEERARRRAEWEAMFGNQVYQPGIHELMQELRLLVDEYEDRVLVGETERLSFCGDGDNELHMVFNFPLLRKEKLSPAIIRANQARRHAELPAGAWPCNTLGNHDTSRVYSHFGDGIHNQELARLSLALVLTLWGTPFLYNGEEIGMRDLMLADIGDFKDSYGIWFYNMELRLGTPPEESFELARRFTRDRCRTPYQWKNAPNAGFSPPEAATWLPVNPDYRQGVNFAEQDADPGSLLNFYRRMLRLRKETVALISGDYTPLNPESEDYFAFLRADSARRQTCLVLLNYSAHASTVNLETGQGQAKILFSSASRTEPLVRLDQLEIGPYEILIAEL
jgi:alpha-glucosidase